NVDLGEGYPNVARAFEGNKWASVDFLSSVANYCPARSTVQVDIRCPSLTFNPLPPGCSRNIDVPAEALMFLLCPGSHFVHRQSVVVQHDFLLPCAEAVFSICSYNASSQYAMEKPRGCATCLTLPSAYSPRRFPRAARNPALSPR